jgi:U3 small nucleolar RNA-associated protein 21
MVAAREPLFLPFRALGYITDRLPFAVQRLGRETYVTVSVGKAWQVCILCTLQLQRACFSMPCSLCQG